MEFGINVKNLKAGYDGRIIIESIGIEIPKNKIISIIGANGCGKSTLLKAIGRIIKIESGNIYLCDEDIKQMKTKYIAKKMAILPQMPVAPLSITCRELIAYGRFPYQKGLGRMNNQDKKIVQWALEATKMTEFADREIGSLSGGQKQKVWIAMALAQQTDFLLLDEPTTYLDLAHQLDVLDLLKKLNEDEHITIVMVLHDLNLASIYSDYIFVMGDGNVKYQGTPAQVINKDMLKECFNVDANIILDKKTKKPVCLSFTKLD